ncbi:MAG TPA: LytTR family DNA-binding domain-containing protein [Bacteroidales bacterium]|nr:LytTR family DNA-binding domain-containing protein [Bacteroidales bacterium]HOK98213.1 LytTR family DNA-binding domain-containing protein [Bacteroidales bacterium]HPO64996.1 LytTR family DNA-binding domain-containing protein [Bacteroidales bacterium]
MNCIIVDDDKLSRKILEGYIKKTAGINLLGSFSNAPDAIRYLKKKNDIELIFLDIEMPEMTGIDFLNSVIDPPQIIITSSKSKYALDAFDFDVADFLLKPFTYNRFTKAIEKVMNRIQRHSLNLGSKKSEIFIKKNSTLVKLRYEEILYIEALENYVVFNTYTEKFTVHSTMKALVTKLPPSFIRVHRSYIINLNAINEIDDNIILIRTNEGDITIPIGKAYRENLMNTLQKF